MTTIITDLPDFFLRALLAGGLLALLTGPLGCVLVWRRMAFFGDALAHAALLGVALGLLLELPILPAVLILGVLFAVAFSLLSLRGDIAHDTLLGILSPTALALGLIALSQLPQVRIDLNSYLFGDVLAITQTQLITLAASASIALLTLRLLWGGLLQLTIARDVAQASGAPVRRLELAFLLLLALVVAVGVQLVGVLLLTALLIIPAATARRYAKTPEVMAVLASLCALLASTLGLFASLYWDIPAGPAMVACASALFLLSRLHKD